MGSWIARSSILRYKDVTGAHRRPLNEIGAELNVGAILESTIQRVENRIKIVTILYDGRTNQRLWGASYDRELKDVFAIQTDLAEQIAMALQAKLSADERANLQRGPTENLNAYDLYLHGRALWELHHQEDNDQAIALFKQALKYSFCLLSLKLSNGNTAMDLVVAKAGRDLGNKK